MNQELFKKIDGIITPAPELLHMDSWEEDNVCGTTRCITGWAIYLTTGAPLYGRDGHQSGATLALARRLGVEVKEAIAGREYVEIDELGAAVLELAPAEKAAFYVDNDRGARFVELAAAGDEEGARSLLGL